MGDSSRKATIEVIGLLAAVIACIFTLAVCIAAWLAVPGLSEKFESYLNRDVEATGAPIPTSMHTPTDRRNEPWIQQSY